MNRKFTANTFNSFVISLNIFSTYRTEIIFSCHDNGCNKQTKIVSFIIENYTQKKKKGYNNKSAGKGTINIQKFVVG